MNARSRLIVPLDVPTLTQAEQLVRSLQGVVGMFKIGLELFTAAGPACVNRVCQLDQQVFLDLKFHDIPNTVAGAVASAVRLGVRMLNLHASGGAAMMKAAVEQVANFEGPRPILLGVTMLTSLSDRDLSDTLGISRPLSAHVAHLARQAQEAGMDGVVASPHEIRPIRDACGESFVILTPGVRPAWSAHQDQKRVMTPREALDAGADYLVIGRPIRTAPDPREAAERILAEMEG